VAIEPRTVQSDASDGSVGGLLHAKAARAVTKDDPSEVRTLLQVAFEDGLDPPSGVLRRGPIEDK
jgi:hypothetical protein